MVVTCAVRRAPSGLRAAVQSAIDVASTAITESTIGRESFCVDSKAGSRCHMLLPVPVPPGKGSLALMHFPSVTSVTVSAVPGDCPPWFPAFDCPIARRTSGRVAANSPQGTGRWCVGRPVRSAQAFPAAMCCGVVQKSGRWPPPPCRQAEAATRSFLCASLARGQPLTITVAYPEQGRPFQPAVQRARHGEADGKNEQDGQVDRNVHPSQLQ